MQIVTSRDFRANQRKYFDIAEREPVFVMRRGARPVAVSAVNDNDVLSAEDLQAIARGLEDIKCGRVHKMGENESLDDMLGRLGYV